MWIVGPPLPPVCKLGFLVSSDVVEFVQSFSDCVPMDDFRVKLRM